MSDISDAEWFTEQYEKLKAELLGLSLEELQQYAKNHPDRLTLVPAEFFDRISDELFGNDDGSDNPDNDWDLQQP